MFNFFNKLFVLAGKKSRRKMIDLQPLVLTEVDFEGLYILKIYLQKRYKYGMFVSERGPRKKRKLDLGGSESKILSKPTRTSIRNSFGSTLRRSNNQNSARALNLRKVIYSVSSVGSYLSSIGRSMCFILIFLSM